MALPRVIKNFNVFVDGRSYFGIATEATIPQPKIMTEAHRGSGMDGPVGLDMGMEGMSLDATFAEWDRNILVRLGRQTRLVFRPGQSSATDFTARPIIVTCSGLVTASETAGLKPGTNSTLKLIMDVRAFKFELDGEVLYDIDLVNAKRIIDGVDQLADIRRAMGI